MKAFNLDLVKILIFYQHFVFIKSSVETAKGPCEDFYEYACSNYTEQNIDPNYSEVTQQLDYEMNKKLLEHFENSFHKHQFKSEQTFCDKMFIYLESCRHETQRNLRKYFEEIRPSSNLNWPLLAPEPQWLQLDKHFDLWSLLGEMQSYGLNNVIVNQQITRNEDNSLNVWLAPVTLSDESALPKKAIMQVLLMLSGVQKTELVVKQLHDTDLKLRELIQHNANSNQVKTITIHDLAGLYPRLNLKSFLEQLLEGELNNILHITLENPEYFEFLNQMSWSAEQLENMCNYLMMKFLYYLAVDSTAELSPLDCVKDLRNKFDLGVNFYYYQYFFQQEEIEYRKSLFIMLRNIQHTMKKYLELNHLHLSSEQIIHLKRKLKKIKINIGNLPNNFDYYSIQQFYQEVPNLDRRNYYKNHLLLLKHRFLKSLSFEQNQSHYIVSDNRMGGQSSPYYVAQQNMVVIPFGSFQLPLFHYTQSTLEQLSLFGFVLAHELAHAFDSTGLNYDQQGFPLDIPSDITNHANFKESVNCMQHIQFTEAIDERIADFFAVRVVYRTYLTFYSKGKEDLRKVFFMNLAQFFCGKNNLKFIDHDSDAMRLQLIVKNFHPFSTVFKCPRGSPMHPEIKCRIY